MLKRIAKEVPKNPGCYIYFNAVNEVIYIGKAKNLRSRMSSYFNREHNIKTTKLVSEIIDFKFYITTSENESLLLERNLIRKYNPKYNVLLKDDKSYPYLVLTFEKHPRLLKVRDKKMKGEYFGPFPNNKFATDVLEIITKNKMLRTCTSLPNKECLYFHLKQCYGPCIKDVSKEEVEEYKKSVLKLLKNNMKELKKLANENMIKASEMMNFENAAKYRDIVYEIEENDKRQAVQLHNKKNFDVISYHKDNSWISISIVQVKDGIVNNINSSIQPYYDDYKQIVISYLFEYYKERKNANDVLSDDKELSNYIKNFFSVDEINSNLSEYSSLVEMAKINASVYFKNNVDKISKLLFEDKNRGFTALKSLANNNLNVIEMFDISHNQGDAQVAGKVVYIDGKRTPKMYRKYKIKTANAKDEYGSMTEVLERRIKRIIDGEETPPNLIILDGGKQQVNIGKKILDLYGLSSEINLIGLVKDDNHKTRAIINKNLDEYDLDSKSALYKFLYEIQEEVHRYTIDFHHTIKNNEMVVSELDKIEGLGPKRKKQLLLNFKTLENVRGASLEELKENGIPKNVANNIYKHFNVK